jgi:hypothetical protein
MRLLLCSLIGATFAVHHNIRAELMDFDSKLNALRKERDVLDDTKRNVESTTAASLRKWEKAERKSEKLAVAELRKNDMAFDMVESEMDKRIHQFFL